MRCLIDHQLRRGTSVEKVNNYTLRFTISFLYITPWYADNVEVDWSIDLGFLCGRKDLLFSLDWATDSPWSQFFAGRQAMVLEMVKLGFPFDNKFRAIPENITSEYEET